MGVEGGHVQLSGAIRPSDYVAGRVVLLPLGRILSAGKGGQGGRRQRQLPSPRVLLISGFPRRFQKLSRALASYGFNL